PAAAARDPAATADQRHRRGLPGRTAPSSGRAECSTWVTAKTTAYGNWRGPHEKKGSLTDALHRPATPYYADTPSGGRRAGSLPADFPDHGIAECRRSTSLSTGRTGDRQLYQSVRRFPDHHQHLAGGMHRYRACRGVRLHPGMDPDA